MAHIVEQPTQPDGAAPAAQASLVDRVGGRTELIDWMLDGVMEWEPDAGTTRYSARWKAQLGYEPHELPDSPDTLMKLSHPDDLPRVRELLDEFLDACWPFSHAWRMRHQTGQWRWMHCRMTAVLDPAGRVRRVLGTFTDITERVTSEQRLKALVSAIPDLLLRVRLDGTVLDAKPAEGVHDFGMLPPAVGTPLADWLPEHAAVLLRAVQEAHARESMTVDLALSTGKGAHRLIELRIVREGDDGAVLILRDVTDERHHANQQMQSQKLEAIGQLAAGIAHEINTPAQFVSDSIHFLAESYAQTRALIEKYREAVNILATLPDQEARVEDIRAEELACDMEYVQENTPPAFERALDGLARVASIVVAMREFAHPDHRDKQRADLNRAILTTLTIARNEYKYLAHVETQLGEIPPVMCHLGDMNQVFLNIIVNASHAIGEVVGKSGDMGTIRVRTRQEGQQVVVEVEDTGPGIPDKIRDRVFDPFFTTKEVGRGTGQGLAIARSIVVDKHGGSLTFDTTLGKGTTFRITLPVADASASS